MVGTGDRIPKLKVKKIKFDSMIGGFCACMSSHASSHQHNIIDLDANVGAWLHFCGGST